MFPFREEDAPKRICAQTCKTVHHLADTDLELLDCEYVPNPHYKNGYPMRLYFETQVVEAARLKAAYVVAVRSFRATHSREIKAWLKVVEERKKERATAAAKEHRATAKREGVEFIDTFLAGNRVLQENNAAATCILPMDVLRKIMVRVAMAVEVDGIRGPTVVCKDLCNAAAASKELRVAVADGFSALEGLVTIPSQAQKKESWDKLVRSPMTLTGKELNDKATLLDVKSSGPKAAVAANLLKWIGIRCPPGQFVPGAVVLAVAMEKHSCQFPDRIGRLVSAGSTSQEIRRVLNNAKSAIHRGLPLARAYLRERWATLADMEKEVLSSHTRVYNCTCGSACARGCNKHMCAKCCKRSPGTCHRHQ